MRHLRSISVYQYMYYDQGLQFSAGRGISSRAEPRNLAVAAELPCFRGISRNSA